MKSSRFSAIVFKCSFVALNDRRRCVEISFKILYLLSERSLYISFATPPLHDRELTFWPEDESVTKPEATTAIIAKEIKTSAITITIDASSIPIAKLIASRILSS